MISVPDFRKMKRAGKKIAVATCYDYTSALILNGTDIDGGSTGHLPMTVLIVEDEALISAMVSDVLLDRGYCVEVVSNADDALRYMTSGRPVDVLFTDINIAGDVDGTVLAEHARGLRPDLPIVFASGRLQTLEDLRAVPGAACLPKPYTAQQFDDMVRLILRGADAK